MTAAPVAPGAALLLDSHLHLWDRSVLDYPWMAGRDLPWTSLPADPWEGAPVTPAAVRPAAVVVEAGAASHQWDDEVAWVRGLAREHAHLRGMVAAVDYTAVDVDERLARYATDDFVRGVRDNFEGLPLGDLDVPARVSGVLAARKRGLTVDLCIRAEQTDELISLLQKVVAQRGDADGIVVDHLAKPDVSRADAARNGIHALAEIPGLHVKVSGLPPQAGGTVDAARLDRLVREYALPAIGAFGPQRCMIGTDHPVSTLPHGISRADWVRVVVEAAGEDVGPVLGQTAQRFYGV
jgi:L-fuconolactonase